jgi:hypothetical protein
LFVLAFLASALAAQTVSKEYQAYIKAVDDYNDFIDHPKGHVYNVFPRERRLESCYLAGQVIITSAHDPSFVSSNGENHEWERWTYIWSTGLQCYNEK